MNHLSKIDYTTPVANVMDISSESVYCASGGTQKYNVNDYSDGWSEM